MKFEHATGYKQSENVASYNARFHEGRYVIGQIAAKMSKSGVAGYIASFPIPEVVMGINAFILGAQTVNPDFKLKVVWVNTWFDPGKEADAAKVLIGQGADIITQHTDSTAPLQIAEEQGVLGFGQASDMIHFAPKAQLTAIIDEWGPYYVERAQAVLDGTWESGDTWTGMAAGTVVMAPYTNMPDDVAAAAAETAAMIASRGAQSLRRPDLQAGRHAGRGRRRGHGRRDARGHQLVCPGRRRHLARIVRYRYRPAHRACNAAGTVRRPGYDREEITGLVHISAAPNHGGLNGIPTSPCPPPPKGRRGNVGGDSLLSLSAPWRRRGPG